MASVETLESAGVITARAGIDGIVIALPMQMIANLARTISPVAASRVGGKVAFGAEKSVAKSLKID